MNEPTVLTFEEIRPYFDHEVPQVLQRIGQKSSFAVLMQYLFPEQPLADIQAHFGKIERVRDFQATYIHQAVRRMLSDSTDGVTWDGFDQLQRDQKYLFLSNHRDIIMDSAVLNVLLHEQGFGTTQIAIGDNLMVSSLVTDLMKLNKSFVVHRDVARQDMLAYATRLSRYIREQIVEGKDSIWIAHRNGRTKDGNDQTHTGLLKMLNMSGAGDARQNFRELNAIPMAISYEFDPCDGLKAEEMYHVEHRIPYQKDDKMGMVRGIRDPKGRVHLSLGTPLRDWIDELPHPGNLNAWLRELGDGLDREIHENFRLWPNNYIAADWLAEDPHFRDEYSDEDEQRFEAHLQHQLADKAGDPESLRQKMLEIYANPVWNRYFDFS